jgi:hypothetical protein
MEFPDLRNFCFSALLGNTTVSFFRPGFPSASSAPLSVNALLERGHNIHYRFSSSGTDHFFSGNLGFNHLAQRVVVIR